MRDDDELGHGGELLHDVHITAHVRVIKSGVDFVQDAVRARLALEHREQQPHRRHRLLASAQQRQTSQLFARRSCHDVDSAVEHIVGVFQDDVPVPTAEHLAEQHLKVLADRFECLQKQPLTLDVDATNDVFQSGLRLLQVFQLGAQIGKAVLDLFQAGQRVGVDVSHHLETLPKSIHRCLQFGADLGKAHLTCRGVRLSVPLPHMIAECGRAAGHEVGERELVLLINPLGERRAVLLDVANLHLRLVRGLDRCATATMQFVEFTRPLRPLLAERLALAVDDPQFAEQLFLDQMAFCQDSLCSQHEQSGLLLRLEQALEALGRLGCLVDALDLIGLQSQLRLVQAAEAFLVLGESQLFGAYELLDLVQQPLDIGDFGFAGLDGAGEVFGLAQFGLLPGPHRLQVGLQ